MAIKILKDGIYAQGVTFECSCCKCHFMATSEDFKTETMQTSNGTYRTLTAICPQCCDKVSVILG